ncbi:MULTISPECIES: hypothetical protein [unclassified Streptomyces]|uniref:COG1470 family protein n=1 Tax=unclassified Streptomyces TaxID=2593676 RepID=UPI0033FB119E
MPPRPFRPAVLAAALALSAPTVPAAHAAEAAWSAAPAPGGGGRAYFYLEGAPGSVLEDRLALTNPTGRPLTLRLRGTATGTATATSTGAWITPAAAEVRIPPRTRAEVPFAVTVPVGAPPGGRTAALVASGGGRQERVPVRVRVAGPALAALTVEDVRLDRRRSLIHYALVNRGNTVLAPSLAVRVGGLFGQRLRRPARPLPVELPPGGRVELTEPWHPPALDRVEVRLTVTAPGAARAEATASAAYVPWGPAAGAGCAVAGGGVALWLRRGRGRVPDGPGAARPADEPVTTGVAS